VGPGSGRRRRCWCWTASTPTACGCRTWLGVALSQFERYAPTDLSSSCWSAPFPFDDLQAFVKEWLGDIAAAMKGA